LKGRGSFGGKVWHPIVTLWRSCAKLRESIEMLFGVVSGVGQGMGLLDGGSHPPRRILGFGVFLPSGLNGVFERILKTQNVFDSCVKSL